MGKNQWVVKSGNRWGLRGEGNSELTSQHRTQKLAANKGRRIAKKEKSELFIQGRDGKIVDRDSFGNDPFPPRDGKH